LFHFFGKKKIEVKKKYFESDKKIPHSIDQSLAYLQKKLGKTEEVKIRHLYLQNGQYHLSVVFMDSITDSQKLNKLIESIQNTKEMNINDKHQLLNELINNILPFSQISILKSMSEIIESILSGHSALLIEGIDASLSINMKKEEIHHTVVLSEGSSFIEDINTNIRLIRNRCKHEGLRFLKFKIGQMTNTEVNLVFIDGICEKKLVQEIKQRIDQMDIDDEYESFYIEEWIVDHPTSIFPQMNYTERPEKVVDMLLKGHVAIVVDGAPWSFIAPTVFLQFFSSDGNRRLNPFLSNFLNTLRILSFFFSILFPPLYIALTTIHQEILPTSLALQMAAARSVVPFPTIIEALIIELTLLILREASVKLSTSIGNLISIVGIIIAGQVAVGAGIVSSFMFIVIALSGISSFMISNYSIEFVTRVLRFPFMIIASILGLPGIIISMLILIAYMASVQSFGVPYLAPITPYSSLDIKGTFIRNSLAKKRKKIYKNRQRSEFEVEKKE